MVAKAEKKAEIITGLELALSEILNVNNMNVWISVKERSIIGIMKEAGVQKGYAPILLEELRKLGLVENEGERGAMRYKIISNVIPDVNRLATTIYERYLNAIRKYKNTFDGYPTSSPSDLRPKRSNDNRNKSKELSGKVVRVARQIVIPVLGDMRFVIHDNMIVEGRVIAVYYGEKEGDENKMFVDLKFSNELTSDMLRMIPLKEVFETPDKVAEYLVRKCLKFQKK